MSNERAVTNPAILDRGLMITSVERMDGTELIVEFSDGTYAVFTAEQLMRMVPKRNSGDLRSAGP